MAYEYQGFASLSVNLNRQKYGSLDISEVFKSQADLNYYISKGAVTDGASDYWLAVTPYPYAGQYIALVNNETREVSAYILVEKEDGTFETKEVGSAPIGDEKSITVDDEGVVKIVGFDSAEAGAQPRKKADGTVEWIKPDTTTVEGLQVTVDGLQNDVSSLWTYKAEKTSVYTKEEIDNKLSTVYKYKGTVATYSALPTADRTVGDVYNVEAADAENGIEAGDNVAWNGTGWDVLGGTVDLSDYALISSLDDYVKKNGTDRLITADEGDAIAALINGDYDNYVKSVDTEEFDVDASGNLTIKKVAMSKVAYSDTVDLGTYLGMMTLDFSNMCNDKVDKNGTDRLITEAEGTLLDKLKNLTGNEQANVLEAVRINGTDLAITDKAVNIPVGGAKLGVVMSATGDNKVTINENGAMSVNAVNVNTLTQTDGETLILNGGSAAN